MSATNRARDPSDDQIINLWLSQFRPATQKWYNSDITRFKSFCSKPLEAVTPADIHNFISSISGSAATKSRALAALKSLFRFGVQYGLLNSNPAAPVRGPKVFRLLGQKYLSEAEVDEMILHEPEPRNKLLIQALYLTGLRVSEICSLTWNDVEVRPELGAPQLKVKGKGGKKRSVVFPKELWTALQELKRESQEHIFSSRTGGSLDRTQVMRIVQAAARRVGIEKNVSPHWLRHAHATHAIANGAPLHVVQQSLGHSSLSVTGLYLHTRPQDSSALYLKKGVEPP